MPIIGTAAEVNRHAAAMDAFAEAAARVDALYTELDSVDDAIAIEDAAEALNLGMDALLATLSVRLHGRRQVAA